MNALRIECASTFRGDEIERGFISLLLINNYNTYEPFTRLCQGNKCINITAGIHKNQFEDEETYEHFNITIYDYDTRVLSQTYHCYVNMKLLKIAKITTILII